MSDVTMRSELGRRLLGLLPEVYRTKDREGKSIDDSSPGDLASYLDACGTLLDLIRGTLDQRLADSFPGNPGNDDESACQDWLIPYFAQLFDVRLISPDADGRKDEVARAVSWRQSKGTLTCVDEIAESVGRMSVEVQEGWKRVAMTERIGFQYQRTGTIDIRKVSRVVGASAGDENAQIREFEGLTYNWKQMNPEGVPCFTGSYEDVSPGTMDVRTPDWEKGHFHHKRLLLFVPVPSGMFSGDEVELENLEERLSQGCISREDDEGTICFSHAGERPVMITKDVELEEGRDYRIEGIHFKGTLTLRGGRLELVRCSAAKVVVTEEWDEVLEAKDCLFKNIESKGGVRLEYCTVTDIVNCEGWLLASDCIFNNIDTEPSMSGCIRYSRIPVNLVKVEEIDLGLENSRTNTVEQPVYHELLFCENDGETAKAVRRAPVFGERGYGVLHPATPRSIRMGAEDGGEMGAYHHLQYCFRQWAMLEKLRDYLPVGMVPVLVPDQRLWCIPADGHEIE